MGNKNVYNTTSYCSKAKIIAVSKSEEKGTKKKVVAECILEEDYVCIGNGRINVYNHAGRLATDGK